MNLQYINRFQRGIGTDFENFPSPKQQPRRPACRLDEQQCQQECEHKSNRSECPNIKKQQPEIKNPLCCGITKRDGSCCGGFLTEPKEQPVESTELEEGKKYPIGGYAPGNYFCTCVTCKKEFTGDKRAVQCEPCAVEMVNEPAPSPEETVKEEDIRKEAGMIPISKVLLIASEAWDEGHNPYKNVTKTNYLKKLIVSLSSIQYKGEETEDYKAEAVMRDAEAIKEYPVKMGYHSDNIHGMYGCCDLNYYERLGFIKGYIRAGQMSKDGLVKLIEWLDEINNSVFSLSASEVELKMIQQIKEKATSILSQQKETTK